MKKVLIFIFCLFFSVTSGYASSLYLNKVATWNNYYQAPAFDMDPVKNLLFVAEGQTIHIKHADNPVDITETKDKNEISIIRMKADVKDLSYDDGYLYISNDYHGFCVYHIDDLSKQVFKDKEIDSSKQVFKDKDIIAKSLATNYTYAVVKDITGRSQKHVVIYDIRVPKDTTRITRVELSQISEIKDVFIVEESLLVLDYFDGIHVFYIDDLITGNNQSINIYTDSENMNHLFINKDYGYISSKDMGYCVLDIKNTEMFEPLSCFDDGLVAVTSTLIDSFAVVVSSDSSLWVLDIKNLDDIKIVEKQAFPDDKIYFIHSDTRYLYISCYETVYVYELVKGKPIPKFSAKPLSGEIPLKVNFINDSTGLYDDIYWNFGNGVNSTMRNPSCVYNDPGQYTVTLAISDDGCWYTETKPNYINVKKSMPKADFSMSLQSGIAPISVQFMEEASGNYTDIYWDFGNGHTSSELNPTHEFMEPGVFGITLTVFGSGMVDHCTQYVFVKNNVYPIETWKSKPIHAFCADPQNKIGFAATPDGIDILDINNPLSISVYQSITLTNQATSLFYTQNYLYAACGVGGLAILDISDLKSSKLVKQVPLDGVSNHVWSMNDYVYVSSIGAGVSVIQLTSVSAPTHITTIRAPEAHAMKMHNGLAFVANGYTGFSCYKQWDGTCFLHQTTYNAEDSVVQFTAIDNIIYLAAKDTGLIILEVDKDGKEFTEIGSYSEKDYTPSALDVCIRSQHAFMACGSSGLQVFNIEDPNHPAKIMSQPTKGHSTQVVDVYPYLYVANGKEGLRIFVQPELNQLGIQVPRTLHSGRSYQGKVSIPFVYPDDIRVYLQASHHVILASEYIDITRGHLDSSFSFDVKDIAIDDTDPEIQIKASTANWLDATHYSLFTDNDIIKAFFADSLPIKITHETALSTSLDISSTDRIACLSVRLKMRVREISSLIVKLTSPHNDSILLFADLNIPKQTNIVEIEFDDRASQSITEATLPFVHFYRPESGLSVLKGKPLAGEWQLTIQNNNRSMSCRLLSWSMFAEILEASPEKEQNKNSLLLLQQHKQSNPSIANHDGLFHQAIPQTPEIQLTEVPGIGNRIRPIRGVVDHAAHFSGYLIVYILTDSWHLKPRRENPFTHFQPDGRWQCDITTKPGDEIASQIAVFLFSKHCHPLLLERLPVLPSFLFEKAITYEIYDRNPIILKDINEKKYDLSD